MKEVKAIIPADKIALVEELEGRLTISFDIIVHKDTLTMLTIVDDNQTAAFIEELKGVGIGRIFGKIILSPISIEIDSEPTTKKSLGGKIKGKGISLDEMISSISGLALISPVFLFLTVLAGFLASFGLYYDNVVIIIAAMIIAPFLGPIALTVIGTMLPDNPYRVKAILTEIAGLGACVLIGIFVGSFMRLPVDPVDLNDEIIGRTDPGLGDIVFAIISGLAAGIFIVRGESTSIVGVAVAASLCPPATNIGLLLVNNELRLALGSLLLLSLNVISIYATCAIIFWSSQTLARGGTMSSRQYKKVSKRYYFQILVMIAVLVSIIVWILYFKPG